MSNVPSLGVEDLLPVRSRINWAPIIAGAVVALAVYFLLTLLGGAIGLSVSDDVRSDNLATGAAIWAVISTALALFLGGWLTSQLTVGETKAESVVYGVLLWGVVFAMLMWLLASGVRTGFNAMVGVASASRAVAANTERSDWEDAAARAGVPRERIQEWQNQAKDVPADLRRAAEDPANRQAAADVATKASWWAVLGTIVSMIAAIAGSVMGAGPTFRLFRVGEGRVTLRDGGSSSRGVAPMAH